MPGVTQASAPPDSRTSASPARMQRRRVADRVGRARAAARQHVADAVQPQRDRDLARHHADDRDRNGVRRDLAAALDEEVVVLPLADVDAAAAAADDDAGVRLADPQAGVSPRFARGDDADQRGARIALRIGAIVRVPDVVAARAPARRRSSRRHRRGDAAGELRRVELRDGARAAAAAADVIPEALAADAERRDDADAGDHDAPPSRERHDAIVVAPMGARAFVWSAARSLSPRSSAVPGRIWFLSDGRRLPRRWPALVADAALLSASSRSITACSRAPRSRYGSAGACPEICCGRSTSGSPACC